MNSNHLSGDRAAQGFSASTRPQRHHSSAGEFAAVAAAMIVGHLGPITQPYQVGAVLQSGVHGATMAGVFMGVEIAFYSATLMITAYFISRLNVRSIAFSGAALSILAFLLTGGTLASGFFLGGAALIGIGQGLIFSTAVATAARSAEPEKVMGIAGMIALLFFGAFMAITPQLQAWFGVRALFAQLAVTVALFSVGLLLLPRTAPNVSPPKVLLSGRATWYFLALIALYGIATGGVYAFMERMAHAIGIAPASIGVILMAGLAAGAAGSAASAALRLKLGHVFPLFLALVMVGIASFGMAAANGLVMFAAGSVLYQIFYSFAFPYLVGTAAVLDRSGSLASFVGGFLFIASAAGATGAGTLVAYASYQTLGIIALLACLIATIAAVRIFAGRSAPNQAELRPI